MPFISALSEHTTAAEAAGETAGRILEVVGKGPDLLVCFVSGAHLDHMADIAGTLRHVVDPGALLCIGATSVLAGAREVEERAAVALFAGRFDGTVTPVRVGVHSSPQGGVLLDDLPAAADEAHTLLLAADPYSFPIDGAVDLWASERPHLQVIGGLVSAAAPPGGGNLALDGAVHRDGAVGVLLSGPIRVEALVSQGCRPIGDPMVVTACRGNVIDELAGRPALTQLQDLFERLSDGDKLLVNQGLHIGRVIDEHRVEFGQGDFLIRGVIGADPSQGSLTVGENVRVGSTVQFQVRDHHTADSDLRMLLTEHDPADGALVFTCNGRGSHMFPEPDHDAALVSEAMGTPALAGMFCAGEIGPVGGRTFVHGFTASAALFYD